MAGMVRRVFLALLAIFFAAAPGMARSVERSWTYQEMFDKADLVVIATAYLTKDTKERSTLQDLKISVIGVETEFNTRVILKGTKDVRILLLHHYRIEAGDEEALRAGPLLVTIPPGKHPTFLMFLVKEKDGRYAPVTGQTDPLAFSVLQLNGEADGRVWW